MDTMALDLLTLSRCKELMNTQFDVATPTGTQSMQLIAATPGPIGGRGVDGPSYESFSLTFRGPNQPPLPQGTYCFRHEKLGSLDLFTVPIGKGKDGIEYQVVINRLVKEG
jgi:hypothetical protein